MKLFWHKLKYWEYWSMYIIYMPAFFYWIKLIIKFKSICFHRHINPGIRNGGLFGDSKMEIYHLLPINTYPKTIKIEKNNRYDFSRIISENHLNYPIILKPDIGQRGVNVLMANTIDDIKRYEKKIQKDFLIQELIEHPNELGLFYYRLPSEKTGKITGLTLKRFLTIEGNGADTLEKLLIKEPRKAMQIPKLKNKFKLGEIIPQGEIRCLVPFGNHNRGTAFIDGKNFISMELEQFFDKMLNNIPGFYYGRLDIRYNTIEELERGINFSIIELNGAKSEPTHIYDVNYTLGMGQKEIFRHLKIIENIVFDHLGKKYQSQ